VEYCQFNALFLSSVVMNGVLEELDWPVNGQTALFSALDDAAHCAICRDYFNTPLTLMCGHSCEHPTSTPLSVYCRPLMQASNDNMLVKCSCARLWYLLLIFQTAEAQLMLCKLCPNLSSVQIRGHRCQRVI